MSDPQIPIGSRVRFTARFSLAGKPADPAGASIVVTKAGMQDELSLADLERMDVGVYRVDVTADKPGAMSVRIMSADGAMQKASYIVEDAIATPPPIIAQPRADTVWPRGYDRARALAAIGIDGTGRSDSYVLGRLTQHLDSSRFDAIMKHDDARPLPNPKDEARAQSAAVALVKKANHNMFRAPNAKLEQRMIAQARKDIRMELMRNGPRGMH